MLVVQELQDQNTALREEVDALRNALHAARHAATVPAPPQAAPAAADAAAAAAAVAPQAAADATGAAAAGGMLPEAVGKVRTWWGDLHAVCRCADAHSSGGEWDSEAAADAFVGELKVLFEAYPELLRVMLTDGHVAALCNQLHCPPDLRCVNSQR